MNKTIYPKVKIIHNMQYGSYEILCWELYRDNHGGPGTWKRYDKYNSFNSNTSGKDLDGVDSFFCTGPDDVSRPHNSSTIGEGEYDGGRCGVCYLNFSHTKDYHNQNVNEYEQKELNKV